MRNEGKARSRRQSRRASSASANSPRGFGSSGEYHDAVIGGSGGSVLGGAFLPRVNSSSAVGIGITTSNYARAAGHAGGETTPSPQDKPRVPVDKATTFAQDARAAAMRSFVTLDPDVDSYMPGPRRPLFDATTDPRYYRPPNYVGGGVGGGGTYTPSFSGSPGSRGHYTPGSQAGGHYAASAGLHYSSSTGLLPRSPKPLQGPGDGYKKEKVFSGDGGRRARRQHNESRAIAEQAKADEAWAAAAASAGFPFALPTEAAGFFGGGTAAETVYIKHVRQGGRPLSGTRRPTGTASKAKGRQGKTSPTHSPVRSSSGGGGGGGGTMVLVGEGPNAHFKKDKLEALVAPYKRPGSGFNPDSPRD